MVNNLNLKQRILFIGKLKNPFPKLKQCDIFILPSRWEPFGNVVIEAMSMGLSIISFNCLGGHNELIRNNKIGILEPQENIKKLAEAISLLVKDKTLRNSIGIMGLNVNEKFSLKNISMHWLRLIYSSVHELKKIYIY